MSKDNKYSAPALEKGLDILELLASEEAGLNLSEIAQALSRSVSEIFRMISVLEARSYIALNASNGSYVLTTRLFELAHKQPNIRRLSSTAESHMRKLVNEINQSVHIGILNDNEVLVIAQCNPSINNIVSVRLGAKIPLWKASSSRVILAFLPQEELLYYFDKVPLPKGTTRGKVTSELAEIRARGYEVSDSYIMRGVINIAAPIVDHSGCAIAALTVPYMEQFASAISFETCVNGLKSAAMAISLALGARLSIQASSVSQ